MDKQQYKIKNNDWLVTARTKRRTYYRWFLTKKDAVKHAKTFTKRGQWQVQLFKINYQFKQNLKTINRKKGNK